MEATTFADCCGFGVVFEGNREVLIADPALRYVQIRSRGFADGGIERYRKAYQFLRSALSSEVDRGILLRANSPAEAWRNLESWHNPKSVSATQVLHDRFQSYSMKPGQSLLVALTALEEMESQLSQQDVSMARNQSLIQFHSILPESEYEVEKRTFCNGLQPDREQVLMSIRSRFENLQRQRKKGGRRKEVPGMLSWPTLEGGLALNIIPRLPSEVAERDERVVVREGVETTRMERKNNKRRRAIGLVGVRLTKIKVEARSVNVAARRDINLLAAPIRSAACVAVKVIWRRSAPTSSLF